VAVECCRWARHVLEKGRPPPPPEVSRSWRDSVRAGIAAVLKMAFGPVPHEGELAISRPIIAKRTPVEKCAPDKVDDQGRSRGCGPSW
jgi:hypothetical protein